VTHTHSDRTDTAGPDRPGQTGRQAVGLVAALSALVAVLFIALGLPSAKSGAHDIPIGVAGTDGAVTALTGAMSEQEPGAFDVTAYADGDELREAIRNREVYGGVVVGSDGTQVLTASAGSPVIAQALTAMAPALGQATGADVAVEDVVALPASDPRGTGLAAAGLPLAMAGMLPAALLSRVFGRRPWVAAATAAAAAVGIGAGIAVLLHSPFGSVGGGIGNRLLPMTGAIALGAAAMSLTILGLYFLLGFPGIGLGAVTMVLIGNPLSGLASAPEWLPGGWGAFGQYLPPGATGTLLRSVAYFDGAGSGHALLVLTCWIAAGLGLLALSRRRPARAAIQEA
jgi:hypothetical protein